MITGSGFLKRNNWRSSWGHYVLNLFTIRTLRKERRSLTVMEKIVNTSEFWPPTFGWEYIPEFKLRTTQGMLQDQFLMQRNLRKSIVLAQIIHYWFGEKYFFIFEKKFKKSTCCWYSLLHQWRYNYGIFQDAQAQ